MLASLPCPCYGVVTRADPALTTGYGAGYFARTYTYGIFSPDSVKALQTFPVLVSGSVRAPERIWPVVWDGMECVPAMDG